MSNWKITYLGQGVVQIPGHSSVGCFACNTTASVSEAAAQSVGDPSQWSILSPDGIPWPPAHAHAPAPVPAPFVAEDEPSKTEDKAETKQNYQSHKKARNSGRLDKLS